MAPLKTSIVRRAALLALPLLLILLAGCELRLRGTTVAKMDAAEAVWLAHPILDYHIIVEVKRSDELRRIEVTVRNGEVSEATMILWDGLERSWRKPYALDASQSFPYTIPGLFDTVRGALEHSGRAVIRVDMQGDPPFPRHIQFGPVWEEGQMVRGTESEFHVRDFEALATP